MDGYQVEPLIAEVLKEVMPRIGRKYVIEDDVLAVSRELGYGCMHCATEGRNSQRSQRGLLAAEVSAGLHASECVQLDMQVLLGQNGLECFAQRSLARARRTVAETENLAPTP